MNEIVKGPAIQESLVNQIVQLEKEVEAQLSVLSTAMPEIYSGYANMVRKTMSGVLDILKLDEKNHNNLAAAAEIAARCVEGWGAWKAAKRHNEMLAKLMNTKRQVAANNLSKIEFLLPRAKKLLETTTMGFNAICQKEYNLANEKNETILAAASISCRMLQLYRTNLFLTKLTEYLRSEYKAWSKGQQTSGAEMPDYFTINKIILNRICGSNYFAALEKAADSAGDLKGSELMILADAQLITFILNEAEGIIDCDSRLGSKPVQVILKANKGVPKYLNYASKVKRFIDDHEMSFMGVYVFLFLLAAAYICFFYLKTGFVSQLLLFSASVGASIRIYRKNIHNYQYYYCQELYELSETGEKELDAYCGKIDRPEVDYEEKSTIQETLKGFLGMN